MSECDPSNAGGDPQTGPAPAQRLKAICDYAVRRHDPSTQLPPMPEELREWAQDTLLATGAGVAISGGRQWLVERRAGPVRAPASAPSKAHAARAMAEAQTERLVRVLNASVRGGLRFGGLAAVFYAVQALSGIARATRDFYDTAYAGMAAGAVFGASVPAAGSAARVRSVVLGAALGASVGLPAGLLHDKLVELMPEEARQARQARQAQTEAIIRGDVKPEVPVSRDYDVAAVVIQQLEASLSSSPSQQDAAAEQQQQERQHQQGAIGRHSWSRLWSTGTDSSSSSSNNADA